MQTQLQKYFAQRVKNLFNNLHDFELNGDDVSLHDFRVEIKKLRAITRFLQQIYPRQKLKRAAHLLHSVFHVAGQIREYQLLQQWLQKNNFFVLEMKYYPPEKLDAMTQEFSKSAEGYKDDLKEIVEVLGQYIHATNDIFPEQYYSDVNAHVSSMIRKNLPHTEWHELRKLIKQRTYAFSWLRHDDGFEDADFAFYNRLQENIGQWHDLETIKENFSQRQIYLSQDIEVQKDFNLAWEKLTTTLKNKEKAVEEMLSRTGTNAH